MESNSKYEAKENSHFPFVMTHSKLKTLCEGTAILKRIYAFDSSHQLTCPAKSIFVMNYE